LMITHVAACASSAGLVGIDGRAAWASRGRDLLHCSLSNPDDQPALQRVK
jgi:hypothetical protein